MVATFTRLPTTPFVSPLASPFASPLRNPLTNPLSDPRAKTLGLPTKPRAPAPGTPTQIEPKKGAFVNRYMAARLPLSQRPGFALRGAQTAAAKAQPASLHNWLWPNPSNTPSGLVTQSAQGTHSGGNLAVVSTGYSTLDAELPGGGWPVRQVIELLLPQSACGELRMLLPLLQRTTRAGKTVALISPAAAPSSSPFSAFASLLPSLNAEGLYIDHLMIIQPGSNHASQSAGNNSPERGTCDLLLQAAEQALHSAQFAVVVIWWPRPLKAEYTRRLHAAAAASRGAVFLCRPITAELETSPAALRIALSATAISGALTQATPSFCPNLAPSSAPSLAGDLSTNPSNRPLRPETHLSLRLIKRRGAVATCTLRLPLNLPLSLPLNQAGAAVKSSDTALEQLSPVCGKGAFGAVGVIGAMSTFAEPGQVREHSATEAAANRTARIIKAKATRGTTADDGRQFMSGTFDDIIAALDLAGQAELARSKHCA